MHFLYVQPGIVVVTALLIMFVVAYLVFVPRLVRAARADKAQSRYGSGNNDALQIGTVFAMVGGGIVIVIFLAATVVSLMPFNPHYWAVYEKQGNIAAVSNQLTDGSGDLTYRSYTYQFAGDTTRYVLDDPRAASFTVGDTLSLKCTASWHFQAADTVNCSIRSY